MNHRERALAVLNYQNCDRLPIVHFGFWKETLAKWVREGHIPADLAQGWRDGNYADRTISALLGFDYNWNTLFGCDLGFVPPIEKKIIEELPDGSRKTLNEDGVIVIEKSDVVSIPTEVEHLLKGRCEWDEFFKPRLQFSLERLNKASVHVGVETVPFDAGGRAALLTDEREQPLGLWCGSLFGKIRNWFGVVGLSYLCVDAPILLDEVIETVGVLCYQGVKAVLDTGIRFDFAHFWEDICFKSGPLVNPRLFAAKVGPQYRRITELLNVHGIHVVSVDCDGKIDTLIPTWFQNGVNTMFPIEVGTWNASIAPWREKYGKELRGVGGMDKRVFAQDYAAIDAEIERLKPLVALGGYIPCPDHRIPLDAQWENVRYYCDRMRQVFEKI